MLRTLTLIWVWLQVERTDEIVIAGGRRRGRGGRCTFDQPNYLHTPNNSYVILYISYYSYIILIHIRLKKTGRQRGNWIEIVLMIRWISCIMMMMMVMMVKIWKLESLNWKLCTWCKLRVAIYTHSSLPLSGKLQQVDHTFVQEENTQKEQTQKITNTRKTQIYRVSWSCNIDLARYLFFYLARSHFFT